MKTIELIIAVITLIIIGIIVSYNTKPGKGICYYIPALLLVSTGMIQGLRHMLLETCMYFTITLTIVSFAELLITQYLKKYFNSKLEEHIHTIKCVLNEHPTPTKKISAKNIKTRPTNNKQKTHSRIDIKERKIKATQTTSSLQTTNPRINKKLTTPIENLHFSTRVINTLKALGIENIADLLWVPPRDLMKQRGFGKKSLTEIYKFVKPYKQQLGHKLVPENLLSQEIRNKYPNHYL